MGDILDLTAKGNVRRWGESKCGSKFGEMQLVKNQSSKNARAYSLKFSPRALYHIRGENSPR